jgi:glycerophosphoryl diester phosphodiesterase
MKVPSPCLALAALSLFSLSAFAVDIVAHRGASHDAPENTLSSFKLGWEQGADADELDIYLTKDGRIVVLHDKSTKRTAELDRNVNELTLEEVRALDAGSWKGPQWKGERIPTLEEVLAIIPDGKRLFIEIKCGPEVLPELARVIKASGKKDRQLVIIGFVYDTMKQAKERFPALTTLWIVGPKKESQGLQPSVDELIGKARAARLDGLDLGAGFAIDEAFVARVKQAGLQVHVWTVDDAAAARKLAKLGVDGITTNRPGWLREQLGGGAVKRRAARLSLNRSDAAA